MGSILRVCLFYYFENDLNIRGCWKNAFWVAFDLHDLLSKKLAKVFVFLPKHI
jgi:hypothetical protein